VDESKPLTIGTKYAGAAAVGTRVVFAPYGEDNVGVFDTADNSFTTFGITSTGNYKYWGQGLTLVHSSAQPKPFLTRARIHLINTPHSPLTPPTHLRNNPQMHPYPTTSADVQLKGGRVSALDRGAAAVGSKVYFGPDNEDNVGRGLHSSTFRRNVGAFCGIGGAFRGCVRGVWAVLRGMRVVWGVCCVRNGCG